MLIMIIIMCHDYIDDKSHDATQNIKRKRLEKNQVLRFFQHVKYQPVFPSFKSLSLSPSLSLPPSPQLFLLSLSLPPLLTLSLTHKM